MISILTYLMILTFLISTSGDFIVRTDLNLGLTPKIMKPKKNMKKPLQTHRKVKATPESL